MPVKGIYKFPLEDVVSMSKTGALDIWLKRELAYLSN